MLWGDRDGSGRCWKVFWNSQSKMKKISPFPRFFRRWFLQASLEFDDEWPFFLGFECNYFEYPSRFFERGRSRDCGARGRTWNFMGHIFFWSWPDNIYYGIDAIIITATLTYVDRLESRFFIQGGRSFPLGYSDIHLILSKFQFHFRLYIRHELPTSW